MKQVTFSELGYFTEKQINAIKDELDGVSYMSFNVTSSNYAGNRTLIVSTDYKADEEEIKNFFSTVHCLQFTDYQKNNSFRYPFRRSAGFEALRRIFAITGNNKMIKG